jgi:hypothetical protein
MNIDQDALDLLRQQVAADIEKNRIAQETLTEMRRKSEAEQRRSKIMMETFEHVACMPGTLKEIHLAILGLNEFLEDISIGFDNIGDRLARGEEIDLIMLSGRRNNGNKERADELIAELKRDRDKRLLLKYQRNLNKLLETAAMHGVDVPLVISNQIEETKAAIARLEDKLNG